MLATLTALAEPNRLRILELLRTGPRPVGEISERLKMRQPQVSKHLQHLKNAGLVVVHPLAQQRVYEVRAAPLAELHAWTEKFRELWADRLDALEDVIDSIQKKETKRKRK
ncbi:MAG TPA: metalloregulator ArsR/SmtB family transcription factor [Polyangiaceae bacterium]|nr:metalloregulator ArsR/SmtB family transcription factor [Polyangiaceae bacterium]